MAEATSTRRSKWLPAAPFAAWLRAAIEGRGTPLQQVADQMGMKAPQLSRYRLGAPVTQRTARRLAEFFEADPIEVLALAGYSYTQPAPDPWEFETIKDWLTAALALRGETAPHAAVALGMAPAGLRSILKRGVASPHKTTLRRLAGYMGVDPARLLAMRVKSSGHIAGGKAVAEKLGPGHYASMLPKGIAARTASPERRSAAARFGSMASLRRTTTEQRQEWAARSAALKRNGVKRPCLFCGDKNRLIYQSRSQALRGIHQYHPECWKVWTASLLSRDVDVARRAANASLVEIWRRVLVSGDEELIKRVRDQMGAQIRYLANPGRRGRPATLLRDRELAIHAAELAAAGVTAREIGALAGWTDYRDQMGSQTANRWAQEMIRFGRALLGEMADGASE